MEIFAKIVNDWKSIVDVSQGSGYASAGAVIIITHIAVWVLRSLPMISDQIKTFGL